MDGDVMELEMPAGDSTGEYNRRQAYSSHRLGYNPQVENGGYDPELENERLESKRKIHGRFEHIFQKYGKDFEGVADEIDMETGVIVVNNGHLQNMEHEVDAGNGDALALSRTFEDEAEDVDDEDGTSSSDSEYDDGQGGADDSDSASSDNPALDFSWQEDTTASFTSVEDNEDLPNDAVDSGAGRAMDSANQTRHGDKKAQKDRADTTSQSPGDQDAADGLFGGLKTSMLALKSQYEHGQAMAPAEIEALGMSIANQLATFIAGGKSKKRKRHSVPVRENSSERSRGRFRPKSRTPIEPVPPSPPRSPGSKSLWAPLEAPKGRKRRATKDRAHAAADETGEDTLIDSIVLQSLMHQSALEPDELQGPTTVRSCSHCKITETQLWRKGRDNADLCNSCGMYYYRYGLMRPLHDTTPDPLTSTAPEQHQPIEGQYRPAPYSANTSRPLDGVNLFGMHFTAREDAQIIKLKEIDGLSWDQVAVQHPGRTPYALQCRYSKWLVGRPCEGREILTKRGYVFDVDAKGNIVAHLATEFTDEEDDTLLRLREEEALGWEAIAQQLSGRIAQDVEERYEAIAEELLGGHIDDQDSDYRPARKPKSKKKPRVRRQRSESAGSSRSASRYTPAEDDTILRLREDEKQSWEDVAKQLPGRTTAAVQRRYARDIGPRGRSRSLTPRGTPAPEEAPAVLRKYTEEEDSELMRLRDEEQLGYDAIAQHIEGRSAASLKNRYYYKTNSDRSRASSRASSIASTSATRMRTPTPQLDDAKVQPVRTQDNEPPQAQEESFTEAEDRLIVQLRELECLPWDQIAAEMPGRDVSSISCRYYQYLLPQKVPEVRGECQSLDPALQMDEYGAEADVSSAVRALEEYAYPEADRQQSHDDITPGTDTSTQPKATRKGSAAASKGRSVARRSDAPMLRRALQKNLNRRSESQGNLNAELPDLPMMMDGANDDPLLDDDAPGLPQLLPSALPDTTDTHPPASERRLRSSSQPKSMYPETPLRTANRPYPSSGAGTQPHAPYVTPSRYQIPPNPYFVPNAALPEVDPELIAEKTEAKKRQAAKALANSELARATKRSKSSSKKRRSSKAVQGRAAPAARSALEDVTDQEEVSFDDESVGDDNAGEYYTSRKRQTARSKAQQSYRGRASGISNARKRVDDDMLVPDLGALASNAEEETEEEDIDMPDLGTDDDQTSSESEVEDEDDDDLRCKSRAQSPLFDPRETIAEARQRREEVSKPGDGRTMETFDTRVDLASIAPEDRARPDLSWTQLNFQALKSRAPEPMHVSEIYAYLEQRYLYFRLCKGHWRDAIRGNLSTKADFVKHDASRTALWRLADPAQEAVAVLPGKRKGRVPSGLPRPEKPPKRKVGRPSNVSKGLELKRQYKRNYVPVAERRRLAEMEGARGEVEGAAVEGIRKTVEGGLRPFVTGGTVPRARGEGGIATSSVGVAAEAPATVAGGECVVQATASNSGPSHTAMPRNANEDAAPAAGVPSHLAPIANMTEGLVSGPVGQVPPSAQPEIKEESAPPAYTTPMVIMTAPPSAMHRELTGSDAVAAHPHIDNAATPASTIADSTTTTTDFTGRALRSSSPTAPMYPSTRRLSRTYGRANTPGTARSTLFGPAVGSSSAAKATPGLVQAVGAAGRSGTPSGLRRIVQTPVRDGEGSEDELA